MKAYFARRLRQERPYRPREKARNDLKLNDKDDPSKAIKETVSLSLDELVSLNTAQKQRALNTLGVEKPARQENSAARSQGNDLKVDATTEQSIAEYTSVVEEAVSMNRSNNNEAFGSGNSNQQIFHEVSGEVGNVKNLPDRKNLTQMYFKARFDSNNKGGKKRRASFSHQTVLFKTANFPYSSRQHLGIPFQHRGTISSSMYLILEVKGKGKTHEAVDYVAVTLGELFAGKKYSSSWLEMNNGSSIHVTMTCKEVEAVPGSPGRTGRSRLSFRQKKNVE